MQRYTVYLYLETALHVSGGTSTHHQERIQLYLQHLVYVRHRSRRSHALRTLLPGNVPGLDALHPAAAHSAFRYKHTKLNHLTPGGSKDSCQ